MKLVIAEKPSVAQSIAKVIGAYDRKDGYVEGSGYIVSWCVGHLVGLAQADAYDEKYKKWSYADLPIIPDKWKYVISQATKKQFMVLKELMNRDDVTELIEATDAGREGELIFRLVYEKAGCRKPFYRLWISSMEDEAIREGFHDLRKSSDYDSLYEAAVCRSQADWLVGINGTRLFSTLYDTKLTVGRVQTPTLALVVERAKQIAGFEKQKYFNIHLDCNGMDVVKEKIFGEDEAEKVKDACDGKSATVKDVISEKKTINPPKLYDLTTLQREANRVFGYTAQKTLDYTQSLYEKKLVTYPRTDSQYLTDEMGDTAAKVIKAIFSTFSFMGDVMFHPDTDRVLNSKKVSDHHAIIPTVSLAKEKLDDLSEGEKNTLLLISQRLLCATALPHVYGETTVIVECAGYEFSTKGKSILQMGWRSFEESFRASIKAKTGKDTEEKAINASKGQVFERVAASISEHYTTPPKPYTEDTLLSAMEKAGNEDFEDETEKKGLGTPATRAAILEKLVSNGYLERKGKQVLPTKAGENLIAILPERVKSAKLTADWENILMQIEKKTADASVFMRDITDMVSELVKENSTIPEGEKERFAGSRKERETLGKCTRCGSPVYEGQKNYYCSNRDCHFSIWKESKFLSSMKKKVTKSMAVSLLKSGKVFVKGLYSQKKDKEFDAYLVLDDTGEYVNFKLEFPKKGE